MDWKLSVLKMAILPKLSYRYNKKFSYFFVEIEKLNLKGIWTCYKGPRKSQIIFLKEQR